LSRSPDSVAVEPAARNKKPFAGGGGGLRSTSGALPTSGRARNSYEDSVQRGSVAHALHGGPRMSSLAQRGLRTVIISSVRCCSQDCNFVVPVPREPVADGFAGQKLRWLKARQSNRLGVRASSARMGHEGARQMAQMEYSGSHRKAPCGGRVPAPSPRSRCPFVLPSCWIVPIPCLI
jgi:hypothetical protein